MDDPPPLGHRVTILLNGRPNILPRELQQRPHFKALCQYPHRLRFIPVNFRFHHPDLKRIDHLLLIIDRRNRLLII